MNNRQFSKDKEFIESCKRARVEPTKRQASKFRRKTGLAYRELRLQRLTKARKSLPTKGVDSIVEKSHIIEGISNA